MRPSGKNDRLWLWDEITLTFFWHAVSSLNIACCRARERRLSS